MSTVNHNRRIHRSATKELTTRVQNMFHEISAVQKWLYNVLRNSQSTKKRNELHLYQIKFAERGITEYQNCFSVLAIQINGIRKNLHLLRD